jgi:hypothetical protein
VIHPREKPVPPPPEDAQIEALLGTLPEEQLYALALLTYVGRGDYTGDDLTAAYQTAREILPRRELAIAQIIEQKTLADYLADVMEELQKRHVDLDNLKLDSAVAVS